MKAAWRSGDWHGDRVWRRRYMAFAGMMFVVIGGFGCWAVFGPAWLMLFIGVVLLYVLIRTAWMFWRA